MEINSYGTSSMEQDGGYHTVHGVSMHAKQLSPGLKIEKTGDHMSRRTESFDNRGRVDFHERDGILNNVYVQNTWHPNQNYNQTNLPLSSFQITRHPDQNYNLANLPVSSFQNTLYFNQKYNLTKVPESSSCKCSATIVRPFKCGLCLRAYSTICQLYEHLEYDHWETEKYVFNTNSRTALKVPLSSAATQTDAETIQCEDNMVDRYEAEAGDAEQEVKYPCGEFLESTTEVDEKEQCGWNAEVPRKDTVSNYNKLSAGDSEVLNSHDAVNDTDRNSVLTGTLNVPVKTEVLSAEDDSQMLNADDSEVLNAPHEYVIVKTEVLSTEDNHTSQDEICDRLDSKEKRKNKHILVKRKNKKSGEHNKEKFCKICNKQFSSREYFLVHRKRLHSNVKNVICQNCGEGFVDKSSLHVHHARCLNIRRPCPFEHCDKTYRNKTSLKAHIARHEGQLPFVCNECGVGFSFRSSLKTHKLQKHTGERPWKCDQCVWAFQTKGGLSKHMRIHTERKMLPCNTCGKEFSNKWNLEAHVRQHTGEKPFVCEICGAAFIHNVSRKAHMKVLASGV